MILQNMSRCRKDLRISARGTLGSVLVAIKPFELQESALLYIMHRKGMLCVKRWNYGA